MGTDIDDIGNLLKVVFLLKEVDLLKVVFMDEKCENLKVVTDAEELTRNINQKKE